MNGESSILAIDQNQRNLELLNKFLSEEGYKILTANTLEELERHLDKENSAELVLLDLAGFDHNIWKYCERIREMDIPFIIISSKQSTSIHQAGLVHGAGSVLIKPLMINQLLGVIRSLLSD